MAQNEAIARPYARALFELAGDGAQLQGWSAFLQTAAATADSPEIAALLNAPGADADSIAALIADVCAQDSDAAAVASTNEARNFLRLVAENRRLADLGAISAAFEALKAEVENTVDVTLRAAVQVDAEQQATMTAALKRRFGRDVRLHFVLDESLIGGARLQADDHVIDGSVRTRLEKLASALVH